MNKGIIALFLAGGTYAAPVYSQVAPAAPAGQAPVDRAQAPQSSDDVGGDRLSDIVVTAQRRQQNLQSVPIAISAFSNETLERAGVTSTTDLPLVTPGLTLNQATGFATPYLRGVGSLANGSGTESPVAIYVDDVYRPFRAAAILNLTDVEQVAVLKGPQGTLFGRNATGGLLQITTREPGQQPHADIRLSYANYDTVEASANVSGGLTTGVAASLSAYNIYQGKGWGTNLTTGKDTNQMNEQALRGKLIITPGNIKVTLAADYSTLDTSVGLSFRPVYGQKPTFGPFYTGRPYDTLSNYQPGMIAENYGGSIKVEQSLGALNITNITAYQKSNTQIRLDQDVEPINFLNTYGFVNEDAVSEELRVAFKTNFGLQIQGGAFLFWSGGAQSIQLSGLLFPTLDYRETFAVTRTRSYAGYVEATQNLGTSTRLTLGGRYTSEKRTIDGQIRVAVAGTVTPVPPLFGQKEVFKAPSWRVALDHDLADHVLAYVSYNRGFKSGGFNPSNPAAPAFRPEKLDAFEAGLKSEVFDRRLRLNLAGFYYKYRDIQLNNYVLGTQTTINAASAELYGLDVDAQAQLAPRLQLSGGLELLHAKFLKYPAAPGVQALPAGGNAVVPVDASGNDLPSAPHGTGNAALSYTAPLAGGKLGLNGNVSYNSGYFGEGNNFLRQSAFTLVNARVSWTTPDDRLTFSVFGRNLTNRIYSTVLSAQSIGSVLSMAAPRTYGAMLAFKF